MKLKTGDLFWPSQNPSPPAYPPLPSNSHCDVAIVGAGVSGALAAYYLTKAGVSVILLDRTAPASASTAASTGLLQYEIDVPLLTLAKKIGPDSAAQAYRLCFQTLDTFRQLDSDLHSRLHLRTKQSLYLAHHPSEIPTFEAEAAARRSCNIPVQALSSSALAEQFQLHRPAALLSNDALDVDPVLLTLELLRSATSQGLTVHAHTTISSYDADSAGVTLRTPEGLSIRAQKIIFATGYETPQFVSLPVSLNTTFALISQPLPTLPEFLPHLLIWESAHPYLYIRTTPDSRLIVGGADIPGIHTAHHTHLLPHATTQLLAQFHQLFLNLPLTVDSAWAGVFAESDDGLPFIGTSPHFPHGFFTLGYGGNGITFSLIAAQLLTDAFKKIPNPHAHLFRLDR